MKIGFVVNDVSTEETGYTTTRLAMAAINRGHDAWVIGARDPISGLVPLLEQARAFSELAKSGWQPKRSARYWILATVLIVSALTGTIAWEVINPITMQITTSRG